MSWFGGSRKSSESLRSFNVLIYEKDYKELCAWVLKKPNIETGGDLFGLWADKHTAVIQLVLGPGQGCTRTSVSFYQDVNYLERVGSYLTQNEGVCHIGEWHSHHQLGLARPSGGDENTVWNNMPTYNLKRFVIFIANIRSSGQRYNVNIGCFLFETDDQEKRLDVLPGEFTILQKENPLSLKIKVSEKRNKGAEKDDENKISIKDLKLEVKEEGKRPPSVTYLKPPAAQNNKRKGERKNQPQTNVKANDEESSGNSKKQRMDPETSPPITPTQDTIPGSGKMTSDGALTSEDLKNLTISDTQQDQQPEGAMEVDGKEEQSEKKKKEEEEIKEDGVDQMQKNANAKNQDEFSDQKSEREKSKGKENENEMAKMEVIKETRPPKGYQGKPEKVVSDKESPSSPRKEPRPLPKLEKVSTSAKQTERHPLQDEGKAKTKVGKSSGKDAEKKIKTKGSASQGGRPLPKPVEEKAPSKKTGKPLQITIASKKRVDQQSSGKKAGSSGTGSRGKKRK
ncbi:hypothetical protein ACROYT_G017762 [Oculina patagonica]